MTSHPDNHSLRKKLDEVSDEQRVEFFSSGWWHSIDLGGGRITPGVHKLEELRDNYARFKLPDDLSGKRVLDIGCWDGFYSFEAERHGAEVVAIDCWRPETFLAAHRALGSRVEFHQLSVYELSRERLGAFDIVLLLGVLYHLRHPLLALERVCEVTRDLAVIESHVIDNMIDTPQPVMEFYEVDELCGQYDNWWGPNTECVIRLARAAGFARAEVVRREPTRSVVRAYRRWEREALDALPAPRLRDVVNAVTHDHRFPRRGPQAFISLLIEELPPGVARQTLNAEMGGFGINPVYVGPSDIPAYPGCAKITLPIPPGLDAGASTLRVWHEGRRWIEVEISLVDGREW
jgi:tRNA (mo5U34)-methyltransferase